LETLNSKGLREVSLRQGQHLCLHSRSLVCLRPC
jgi:hypothetical protein